MGYLKLSVVVLLFGVVVGERVHYNGDKVFRIIPCDKSEVQFVHQWIQSKEEELDVWLEPSAPGQNVDVHVKAGSVQDVEAFLKKHGLDYKITIEDLESVIKEEERSNRKNAFAIGFDYEKYHRYDEIVNQLYKLVQMYPTQAETFNVGTTYERRQMVGIKVTSGNSVSPKPAIWIDGGIHAREWISPATVMYTLKLFLQPEPEMYQKVIRVLNQYDLYVLPVFNVDGYEYTHTRKRMWRKTRSRGSYCTGVDPNRNWDSKFGGAGTSSYECSDIYRGRKAFSEKEVKQVSEYLRSLKNRAGLKSYWNVHAYSQLLLFPWSYTPRRARDYQEIERVAKVFQAGIGKRYGKSFRVGQPADILYAVAGGSIDWTYEKLGVKYSYAPELRPAQGEKYGFNLPAYYIKASGLEFTDGFLEAILAMK